MNEEQSEEKTDIARFEFLSFDFHISNFFYIDEIKVGLYKIVLNENKVSEVVPIFL